MTLFPQKTITIELRDDRATTLEALSRNTELTDILASYNTNKEFIGQVHDSGFKIISSGRGVICVFIGELQDSHGQIEIRIHTAFKVLFSILMLMPTIALGIHIVTDGFEQATSLLVPAILGALFVRFVLIELSFRFISREGLNKLASIIGIKELYQH